MEVHDSLAECFVFDQECNVGGVQDFMTLLDRLYKGFGSYRHSCGRVRHSYTNG